MLVKLDAINEIPTVTVPPKPVRQWKSLIGLRKPLVGERVRGQNRIRGLLVGQGLPAPIGAKAWTQLGVAGLTQLAKPFTDCGPDEMWRGELTSLLARHQFLVGQIDDVEGVLDRLADASATVKLLRSVPGIGVCTAEVLAVYLGDGRRFRTANEVSAYADQMVACAEEFLASTPENRAVESARSRALSPWPPLRARLWLCSFRRFSHSRVSADNRAGNCA